jgi:glycosyltransferase involved in cell wall biosynthesis
MNISIVIPTRNRLEILRSALACLEAQSVPAGMFEVLVVDDASTDDTNDFLAHYAPPFAFRHFRRETNGGPAIARNMGILAAKGDIVLILNDDALLAPDALAVHSSVQRALSASPVSVLGRFDLPEAFCETLWGYMLQHSDLLFRYPALTHNKVYDQECWWSCNISTPRKALLEAGLFDENFTGGAWGAEDQELGLRLMARGVPVLFRDDCRAVHMHHLTVDGFASMSLARGGGGALFFAKHALPCHYSGDITEQDIAFWRKIPAGLRKGMKEFHALLRQTETLRLPLLAASRPYYSRGDYPQVTDIAYRLYKMRTEDILAVFRLCAEQLEGMLAQAQLGEITMEEAGKILYPLCLLVRFYHDSIGICATDAIYRHMADAPSPDTIHAL